MRESGRFEGVDKDPGTAMVSASPDLRIAMTSSFPVQIIPLDPIVIVGSVDGGRRTTRSCDGDGEDRDGDGVSGQDALWHSGSQLSTSKPEMDSSNDYRSQADILQLCFPTKPSTFFTKSCGFSSAVQCPLLSTVTISTFA